MSVFHFQDGETKLNVLAPAANTLDAAIDLLIDVAAIDEFSPAAAATVVLTASPGLDLAPGSWTDVAPLDTTRVYVVRKGRESGRVYVTAYDVQPLYASDGHTYWSQTMLARTTLDRLSGLVMPDPADVLVFTYGSNMNPERMLQRCPHAHSPEGVILPGYKAMIADGRCDVIADAESRARGILWTVPGADMPALDAAEGVNSGRYARHMGTLADGRTVAFYAMTEPLVMGEMPSPQYTAALAGGMANLIRQLAAQDA